jgi:hypothetical protein
LDGTTRVVFEPLSFFEKLTALIPPPGALEYLCPSVQAGAEAVPGTAADDGGRERVDRLPCAHRNADQPDVFSPGGYRFGDCVRVGLPLMALILIASLLLVPLIWPLTV